MNNSTDELLSRESEQAQLLGELDAVLFRMGRLMSSRQGEFLSATGLTPPQYMLLRTLERGDAVRVSDIAAVLGVKNPAASMLVQAVEDLGCVSRCHDESDHRVVRVSLTEEGRSRLDAAESNRKERMAQLTASLSIEDLRALVRIHKTLAEAAIDLA